MKRERSFIHVNTRLIYQVVNLNKSTIKLYTESGINMAYILGGRLFLDENIEPINQLNAQTTHDQAEPEFGHTGNNIYSCMDSKV